MRPRELPAEDVRRAGIEPATPRCFNEAAGVTRGRRTVGTREGPISRCFNEAAGVTRGRLRGERSRERRDGGFNEAAGVTRGRRVRARTVHRTRDPASMRPRELPAEDIRRRYAEYEWRRARFNEAAGVTRGRRAVRLVHCRLRGALQ